MKYIENILLALVLLMLSNANAANQSQIIPYGPVGEKGSNITNLTDEQKQEFEILRTKHKAELEQRKEQMQEMRGARQVPQAHKPERDSQ